MKAASLQFSSIAAPNARSLGALAQAWLRGDDGAGVGGATLTSAMQQSVWVYACVTAISEQVAHIPFVFSQGERDGEKIVKQGEVVNLFNRPNEYIDRFLFWDLLNQWLLLRGKVFIVALDKGGAVLPISASSRRRLQPASLVILNPDRVQKIVTGHELDGYRYMAGVHDPLGSQAFLPEELICIRTANPFDTFEGLPPLGVALLAAQTDYAAAQFMRGLMRNNADTGLIVTSDQNPGPESIEQMKAAIRDRKRNAGTADKPLFLWGGAKIEKPQISMADMQFLENRKFARQEVCAVFRVAQEILGYTEDANRAVADAARLSFIDNRIAPLCQRLEAAVEPIVKAFGSDLVGWFDIDSLPIRQSARRSRFQGAAIGFNMGVSRNELNKVFDLGLKATPAGEKSYLPYSLQEVGAEGTETQPVPPGAPADDALPEKAGDPFARAAALLGRAKSAKDAKAEHVCGPSSSAYAASVAGSEKRKRTTLRNFFVAQQGRVLSAMGSGGLGLGSGAETQDPRPKTQDPATRGIEDIFDLAGEDKIVWGKMSKLLRGDLEFGFAQIGDDLGIEDFNIPPSDAISWLNERKDKITGDEGVNANTFNDLKDTLQDGLAKGETHDELVARVKDVYKSATDARAETIATTETNTAINSARQMALEEAGVERKGWQAANLEGVRPSHLANEAKSEADNGIPIDDIWPNGLRHPSDPDGDPGEVINCRCFGFAVLPGKTMKECAPRKFLRWEEWLERGTGNAERGTHCAPAGASGGPQGSDGGSAP